MLNKFMYLVHYSLRKKFKSKSFVIVNIILALVLIAAFNMESLIRFFGGDFDDESTIYILNDTPYDIEEGWKQNFSSMGTLLGDSYDNPIEVLDTTKEEAEKKVTDNSNILLYFEPDDENYIKASIITYDTIDSMLYQSLVQSLNSLKQQVALQHSSIDINELNQVYQTITIDRVLLSKSANSEEESMNLIMGVVFPIIILPFFMLTLFLVQIIGGEINEEKQTRSMEIIISNVTPKAHFFSKILSANIFVIVQSILLFLYSGIGLFIRNTLTSSSGTGGIFSSVSEITSTLSSSGLMDKLVYIIPITIVLMILSFLAYSLIAGILASMTVNIEDYQQIQTPLVFICLAGYYLSMMASVFRGSMLIRVLSYIPLISSLLSPALLVIGQITIIDVFISMALLILFIIVLIKFGMKVYKIGILNYSTDKMWKKIWKAVKDNE